MRARFKIAVVLVSVFVMALATIPARADHENDPRTKNLHPMGHIVEHGTFGGFGGGDPDIQSDIAFWGDLAIQGSWLDFEIRDISSPGNPKPISHTSCEGNQGDVVVWENIVVRSWNSPAPADDPATPDDETAFCDGEPVPAGFEGLHVFDISDVNDPVLVASVETECGSHTASGVPDLDNGRLLVYNSPSSGACPGIDIVEVPLDAPENAAYVRFEPAGRSCHDTGVILGDAMTAGCSGGDGFTVWDLDAANLVDPQFRYSRPVPEATGGHSAAFSWDGEVFLYGSEPGGGVQARCQETGTDLGGGLIQTDEMKSIFFFEAASGNMLGKWTLPRPQEAIENCTIHNFNVVPLPSGRYVVVSGNYQAGTWVTEFTDPANPVTLAWSDPPPAPPVGSPFCDPDGPGPQPPLGCDIAGAWSSYWYNNFIYETNFNEGLNIFRFSGRETAGAMRLDHLNPQTQEFTLN